MRGGLEDAIAILVVCAALLYLLRSAIRLGRLFSSRPRTIAHGAGCGKGCGGGCGGGSGTGPRKTNLVQLEKT